MAVRAICFALALAALGCRPAARTSSPELAAASKEKNISAMRDALEDMIDAKQAKESDREYAYEQSAKFADDGSAGWPLARAEIVGRYAESKGLKALWLVKEIESLVLQSIERDADFDGSAARRMLGTLYVLAGDHTEHGDSEEGLVILEDLVDANGEDVRARLRLAEGYVFLGDPDPALEHLCFANDQRAQLRPSEGRLLDRLFGDVGGIAAAGCGGG